MKRQAHSDDQGKVKKRAKVAESKDGERTTPRISLAIPLGPALCPATILPRAPPYHALSIVPWVPRPTFRTPGAKSVDIDNGDVVDDDVGDDMMQVD